MTSAKARLKYRKFPRIDPYAVFTRAMLGFMSAKPSLQPPNHQPCKHPRVQFVSRDEDAEFVECLECREVFESSELKDISIEERVEHENEDS
ncbi:MAG TPA: hypothetical protein VGG14_11295 [Candidatus Sulfotelmatobacter sp.]